MTTEGIIGGWGSHKQALKAIAKFMEINSVIEFGGGLHSTGLFLNREVFKSLESLVTFESDKGWVEQIKTDDPRHTVILETDETSFAARSAGMKADFVFVDNKGDRVELLKHSMKLAPIAAVHDFRHTDVFDSSGFKYVKGFNSHIQTVFVSNTIDLSGLEVEPDAE